MGLPTFGSNSLLDSDTLTVSPGEDSSFPKANATDDRVFTLFKWTGSAPFDLITDAGVGNTSNVDYFGLIGHDVFTQSGTVTFASSPDNVVYTTIFTVTPTDDKIIFRSFTQVTDRFFRLRITGASSVVSIGQAAWGTKVEFPFGSRFSGFDPNDEDMDVQFQQSTTGNIVGSIHRFVERRARLQFPLVSSTFVDGTALGQFREFYDNDASFGKAFFFSWNAGNPGSFERDAIFGTLAFQRGVRRPLSTQLDKGFRDVQLEVVALKE